MSNFVIPKSDLPSGYVIVAYDDNNHNYTYALLYGNENVGWFDSPSEAEDVAWNRENNKGRAF
jgi:hypothetical protein